MVKNQVQNRQKKVAYTQKFEIPKAVPRVDFMQWHFASELIAALSELIQSRYMELGMPTIWVDSKNILVVFERLCGLGFETLTELVAVDFLEQRDEFELSYLCAKYEDNGRKIVRLKVKCVLSAGDSIDSLTSFYKSANWAERECFDMFGIEFKGHKDLRRILMPPDWVGHPLRKSYPLQGDENAAWYEVDTIFGVEYRDIIGPEQRDSARIDRGDSINFAPISKFSGDSKNADTQGAVDTHRFQEEHKPYAIKRYPKTPIKLKEKR